MIKNISIAFAGAVLARSDKDKGEKEKEPTTEV